MIFSLGEEIIFPHPILREPEGLLAIGGSLSVSRLLFAYQWGIYPWYEDGQPILWWWTVPRLMLQPQQVHISHSMKKILAREKFSVTFDQEFTEVMKRCGRAKRPNQSGTWIVPEMIEAYEKLFNLGHAHSVEVYEGDELVGGLYGVAMGRIFCGESMFAERSDASKYGFIHLCRHLESLGFNWIDCQQDTLHLRSLGADLVAESDYLDILRQNQIYLLQNKKSLW